MDAQTPALNFAAFRSRVGSAALRAIADHWHDARGSAQMPAWAQINPSRIARHLTQIWSYKYNGDTEEVTARLAGNLITAGFGKNFRGTPLEELLPAVALEKARAVIRRVVLEPCLYRSFGPLFRLGSYVGEGERIILPLASDSMTGDGVLGASEYVPLPDGVAGPPVELLFDNEEWFCFT